MEKKKFVRKQERFVLFLMLLLLFPLGALAQQKLIKGQVVDEMGEPIIGATVMVKGVTGGTITDIDGNFSIQGKVGSTLSVTYVGYAPLQVKVTKQEGNRLVMKEDAKVLDEVVVVGMVSVVKSVPILNSVFAVSVLLTVASLMYWWMEWSRACRM